jgi:tRNA(Ile)-lysidine synthase
VTAVDKALRGLGTPSAGETLVAALSGGADSVALLDALVVLAAPRGFRVVAAHLDHGLRADSGQDAAFCAELCARLGVPLRTAVGDVRGRARRERGGVEEAARRERYTFLRAVKDEEGAVAIAVAHTRDDQAETFLLRLLRGAGASGLAAMRPRSGDVLRPLLAVSRQQVLRHLEGRGLAWREDPTNADRSLLRNRVRHELLPYLESRFNPEISEALARTASLLADEAELIDRLGRELGAALRRDGDAILLSRKGLNAAPRAQARAAVRSALEAVGGLRGVTAAHVERVLDLASAEAPSGRRLPLPGGREALFRFDVIRVGPRTSAPSAFAYPLRVPGKVELPGGGALVARPARGPAASNEETAVVAVPEGPLVVRTRQPGDRIRRHGRDVSLKRFLMERRVPADLRGGLPLVASGGRVLWVPGEAPESLPGSRFVRLRLERMR